MQPARSDSLINVTRDLSLSERRVARGFISDLAKTQRKRLLQLRPWNANDKHYFVVGIHCACQASF